MPTLGCCHQGRKSILVRSIYICTFFKQQLGDIRVFAMRRLHQRRPAILIALIHISTLFKQQLCDGSVPFDGCAP